MRKFFENQMQETLKDQIIIENRKFIIIRESDLTTWNILFTSLIKLFFLLLFNIPCN